jgi:hypothetical protein
VRADATPVVEWCDVTVLLRGSTVDGLNGVRCCLSGGVVGAVSPVIDYEVWRYAAVGKTTMALQVLGCQLVRCSLVAAVFEGVSIFIYILLLRSSTMTSSDSVRCESGRYSGG